MLARAALRLGDVTGTRTLLGEASRALSRDPAAVVLRGWVDELWGQVEAFTLTELVGPSSLTTAELRVLALMPTHLSFREMGRQLHVSGQHGQDARARGLPQARRLLALRGRRPARAAPGCSTTRRHPSDESGAPLRRQSPRT